MANDKDFKVKNGIKPTVYHESVGTVTVTGGVATLDLSTGSVFEITPTSDIQVSLSNPAASGTVSGATLLLTAGVAEGGVLSAISYSGNSYDYSGTVTGFYNIHVARNGLHFYLGQTGGTIYQFDLSTANDLSTATYNSKSFNASAQSTFIRDIAVGDNGTKLYVGDGNSPYNVYQYTLSIPYDISTASYASKTYSLASQDANYRDIFFKPDGTKMYHFGATTSAIYQHALSTPWDVSTASYESKSLSTGSQSGTSNNFVISPDGQRVIVLSYAPSNLGLFQYTMSTPWDLSTASYDNISYNGYTSEVGFGNTEYGLSISADGGSIYINDQGDNTAYQYYVGNGPTLTYASSIQWAGGTAPTSPAVNTTDVITFTTRDGGTTYTAALAIDGAA